MSKWKSALLVAVMGTATALVGCGDDNTKPADAKEIDAPPDSPPLPPAQLSIVPLTADFGSTTVNVPATSKSFTITNTGGDVSGTISATVMGSGAANFAVETNTCTTLAAAATCTVSVSFTPQSSGAKTANLVVSASPGGSVMSALDGTGLALGNINATPSSSGFPDTVVGATSTTTATFTVTNTGGTTTGALSVTGGGTNPGDFTNSADNCTGNTLAGGATCTFTVAFTPGTAGTKSANFNITGSPGGTATVAVSGTALAQANLRINPTLQDFGSVVSGQTGGNVTFTVTNIGGVTSGTMSQTLTSTDFGIVSGNCAGTTLAAGASCNVVVHFIPQSTGSKSGNLNVMGTPGGTASATLLGMGIPPGQLSPNPGSLSYNSVTVGQTSASQSVTITNAGGATTGALVTALGGNDPSQFVFVAGSNGCQGATLAPGANCTIALTFNPTSGGGKSATLSVTGAPGGTATVGLSGNGIPDAKLDLTPASHDFGTIGRGTQTGFFQFTLTNNGGVTSSIPSVSVNGANSGEFVMSNGCLTTLAPLAQCFIQVRYAPSADGNHTATLDVTGTPGGSTSAGLFGQAVDPAGIAVVPGALDFDNCAGGTSCTSGRGPGDETLIGENSTQTFTVTNNGSAPTGTITLAFSGTNSTEFTQTNNCTTLVAGASCSVVVTFTPTGTGFRTAALTVSASPGGTVAVGLSGDSLPRFQLLAPATNPYDFSNVVINTSAAPTVTVTVMNNEPTTATLGEVLAPDTTNYTIFANGCPANILGYDSCDVVIQFLPTTTGTKTTALTFNGNGGGANNTAVQNFTGKGVDSLILSGAVTDFGSWATGTASTALTFTVTNPANSPTSGPINVNIANTEFQIVSNNCTTLAAAGSCTIQVKFLPTSLGLQTGTISVGATPGGATSLNITGTGVGPAALSAPSTLAFGNVFSGEVGTQTITVANAAGAATSGPVTFSIAGGDGAYTIVTGGGAGTCGATGSTTLAANISCTIKVQFAPTLLTFGAHNADTLTIAANPGAATGLAVALTGTSVSTISVTAPASPFDFGRTLSQGSTTNQIFTVRNNSNNGVTIPTAAISGGTNHMTIIANTCNTGTVASMATCSITVQFAPGAASGEFAGTLTANSANGTASADMTAHSLTTESIAWTELGPIDYGSTLAADPSGASHVYTLKNNGEATTGTITVALGTNSADWTLTNNCPTTLTGGSTCNVTVKFSPVAGASGDLPTTLTAMTALSNTSSSLTGRAVASGGLTLSPPVAAFANTLDNGGVSADVPFTLQNTSGSTQGFMVGVPSQWILTSNTCGLVGITGSLSMGASCSFTLAFKPTSRGNKTGELTITAAGNPQSALSGFGQDPAVMGFNATSNAYGNVATDANKSFNFVLTNNGDVNASGITLSAMAGANPGDFTVTADSCTGASIAPAATCTITVRFAPQAVGPRSANFGVLGGPITGSPQTISLTGTGVLDAVLGISPTPTQSAGSLAVGANATAGSTVTFTVTNGGDVASGTVTVSPSNTTDYTVDPASGCLNLPTVGGNTNSLGAGLQCTVVVKFAPKTLASGLTDVVSVSATPGGTVTGTVTGNGTSAITVDTASPTFGTVANGTGSSGTVTLTFHNNADVATGLLYTQLAGTNATDWTITADNCGGKTLTAQGGATPSCTIDMVFRPRSGVGGKTATLTVSGNPGNFATSNLSGTAN